MLTINSWDKYYHLQGANQVTDRLYKLGSSALESLPITIAKWIDYFHISEAEYEINSDL